ncbi:glycosyltransferase [Rivularia sp. PCC 7116]|uniref:glycosyltransferase family 4 protein n=1 Tax=Rivularia sp. PCC 7116 TaxID=373994 RepID=UPI00029ECE37|nr:glycosyltransferase family 4 protein [Rivularia sp. PCC 7116]AFY58061.1 glycosyltransferase [Rivularia sp. PCC 7116]
MQSKKQLKVSIVVSDLSASGEGRWGGGGVRCFLLAQALQKLEYQVEILGFVFGNQAAVIPQSEIKITTFKGYNYPGFISSASQLLKKLDGDIIYAMRPKPTTLGLSLIKRMNSRKPIILDIDDWELSWFGGEKWKYRPSLKQFGRDVLKSEGVLRYPDHPLYLKWLENMSHKADVITIHTEFLRKRFGGIFVPNGKDTSLFNPELYNSQESKKRYGFSDYKILMFPGAPRPYKGVEDVLMALDKLNDSTIKLVIVGGSPYDNYDAQLIEKWGRWIIQLPKQSADKMPEIVAGADVIVVPQRNTPAALAQFPLKLTDGMSMAKPILATRVGDIPEILADTGYIVDSSNPEDIANTIEYIFQNFESAIEKGKRARERCIENYSIDAMASTLSKVISRL